MSKILKIYILPVLMIGLIAAVWLSSNYLKQSMFMIAGIFENRLPFKVNPARFGGEIIAMVPDKINDGKRIIPDVYKNSNYDFSDAVDLIGYNVHKPTKNLDHQDIWNIDLEFNSLNIDENNPNKFGLIKGIIYIDIDKNKGSNKSYYADDNLLFGNDFNWDYFIEFDCLHKNASMFSYSSKRIYPVTIEYKPAIQVIRLNLPVVESINSKMGKTEMGSHIAAIGLYSPFEKNNFIKIQNAGGKDNNAKDSLNITPYYDIICSSYKIENDSMTLEPVVINDYSDKIDSDINFDDLNRIKNKLDELSSNEEESYYKDVDDDRLLEAYNLFKDGETDEAVKNFKKFTDDSSLANTYIAIIMANTAGGAAKTDDKIYYVNESYKYYDKAEALLKNPNEKFIMLSNRINFTNALPDEIFHKSDLLEQDLKTIIKMDKITNREKAKYYSYLINLYQSKNKVRELRLLMENIKTDFNL